MPSRQRAGNVYRHKWGMKQRRQSLAGSHSHLQGRAAPLQADVRAADISIQHLHKTKGRRLSGAAAPTLEVGEGSSVAGMAPFAHSAHSSSAIAFSKRPDATGLPLLLT